MKHNPDRVDSRTWQAISIELFNPSEKWKPLQLIVSNPLLEILVEIVNLFMRDFKVNAMCKQSDKFHEMVIISFIQKATFKKHGRNV